MSICDFVLVSLLFFVMAGNFLKPSANGLALPMQAPLKLNTSSATGNPRNKCQLKPGYSLMGWVRLGNSGEDLSGTKGRVIAVSSEELSKHNTREDAWMCIRGKVFNVTRYMDYHPGGVDELMRGVGRDATKLFDEVHAWVNYPQLLAKCYVGPLRNVVKNDSIVEDLKGESAELALPANPTKSPEIIPRFDWSQTVNTLTLYIYTRQLCNPGVVLQWKSERHLNLTIQIEHVRHQYEFEFAHAVKWRPDKLRIAQEVGKIELVLSKASKELWPSYGDHKVTRQSPGLEEEEQVSFSFAIAHNTAINHDSFGLSLSGSASEDRDTIIIPPLGYHVSITAPINGESTQRSYTPVDARFLGDSSQNLSSMDLHFLIKSYAESGLLSKHLQTLAEHEVLMVSPAKGHFDLHKLSKHRRIAFLAAGSGLTPFLNLITYLMERSTNRIEQVLLLYFNKTDADIWCHDYLEKLQTKDERFKLINVLSKPSDSWTGLRGRVTKDLLNPLSDKKDSEMYSSFVGVCGPSGFNEAAKQLLKEAQYDDENLHVFQG